jgi:hypothetical protein
MHKYLSLDLPISKERLNKILNTIASGESVTLISLHRSFRSRFVSCLIEKSEANKLVDNKLEDFVFVPVDLTLNFDYIERQIEEGLMNYSKEEGITNKIRSIIASGKRVTFIVDNFNFRDLNLIMYLLNFKIISPDKLKFVFLTLANDFYNEKVHTSGFESVYHNVIEVPYLNREEVIEWLESIEAKHAIKFSDQEKKEIYAFSGGISGLTRHFARITDRYSSIKDAIDGEEILSITRNYWERFTDKEKNVLMSCALGNPQKDVKEFKYMRDLGLIDSEGKIVGNWFNLILKNKNAVDKVLKIVGNRDSGIAPSIFWGGINLNEILTKTEKKILLNLTENKKVSRDEISKVIWGENALNSISDYAIDQAVSRLRKKLDDIGLGGEIIKTLKGEGFVLNGIDIV